MPISIYGHCSVYLPDENAVLVIGGYHGRLDENNGISSDVWAFKNVQDFGELWT